MKRICILISMLMLSLIVLAQTKTLSGTVKDAAGEPIIGASILVKGTTNGNITDIDGNFTLSNITASDILVFSYVGHISQEIKIDNQSILHVELTEKSKDLDEVVVIGYGIVRKRDLTGSVSSIKASDIEKVSGSNAMQAMQAKVPGLDIQQSSGQAGAGLNITLRGNRSIGASNSPLILVDGVEYGSTIDLNPSDIESMEVLKDASSTAIYGTRGANGVIIISTKKGKAGKTKVNLNSYISINQAANVPKLMYGQREVQRLIDAKDYKLDAANGEWGSHHSTPQQVLGSTPNFGLPYSELDVYNEGSYTNWLDLILQKGLTQNYELSISGGDQSTTFSMSGGVMLEEGLLRMDKLNRYNGKLSVDHKVNSILKVGMDMFFTHKEHDKRGGEVFTRSLYMSSITHPYDANGKIILKPSPYYEAHANPLLDEIPGAYQNNIRTNRFFGTGYIQLTPIKGIVAKSLFNVDNNGNNNGVYQDYESVQKLQEAQGGYILSDIQYKMAYTWDNTINYMTDFGKSKHSLTALLGSSTRYNLERGNRVDGFTPKEHYYDSGFYNISLITKPTNTSTYTKSTMQSYFGRINYNFASRYLLTMSLRGDGSSVLADGHKWGYFPSVATAWRINEESFMNTTTPWLDNLKLRLSWGRTGNAAVEAYGTMAGIDAKFPISYQFGGDLSNGRIPTSIGNKNLTWEKTTQYNLGLDFGFFNNRLYGSLDYYINKTSDLLYPQALPPSSVYSVVISNVGKTEGYGFEAQIGGSPVLTKDFKWDSNLSFSTSHDKIVELSSGMQQNISNRAGHIVGQPVNIFYYYETDGCWGVGEFDKYKAEWESANPGKTLQYTGLTGDVKINDNNNNGLIDEGDKKVYDRSPKAILGWNNTLTYKNLTFSFLMYARLGGWMEYEYNGITALNNSNWTDVDYWTPANQGAKIYSPGLKTESLYRSALLYEKASYWKIKDITLAYNLPKNIASKAGMSNLRVYSSLKNFFSFSSVDNYDAENAGSVSFPLSKQIVFGLNIEF